MTRFSLPTGVPQKFSAAVPVRSDQCCCIGCGGCRTGRGTTHRAERAIRPSRRRCGAGPRRREETRYATVRRGADGRGA